MNCWHKLGSVKCKDCWTSIGFHTDQTGIPYHSVPYHVYHIGTCIGIYETEKKSSLFHGYMSDLNQTKPDEMHQFNTILYRSSLGLFGWFGIPDCFPWGFELVRFSTSWTGRFGKSWSNILKARFYILRMGGVLAIVPFL